MQTVCPAGSPRLVLSADDIREAGRDLPELDLPRGVDLSTLILGEAVQAAVDVGQDGKLALRGITSDQGAAGAADATQGQGRWPEADPPLGRGRNDRRGDRLDRRLEEMGGRRSRRVDLEHQRRARLAGEEGREPIPGHVAAARWQMEVQAQRVDLG